MSKKLYIGLDAGVNGGMAFIHENDGEISSKAFRCPRDIESMVNNLEFEIEDYSPEEIFCVAEWVWAFPGDGKKSAFKFGYNYGTWLGILASHRIDYEEVTPKQWMNYFNMPPKMDKKERKRWLRVMAERLFPNIKMTFNISDALLIAYYCKNAYYKE